MENGGSRERAMNDQMAAMARIAGDPIGLGYAAKTLPAPRQLPLHAKPAEALTFTAGRLYRRAFRHALEQMKFLGHQIEWIEQKRFTDSSFVVKGSESGVRAARSVVIRMIEKINAD